MAERTSRFFGRAAATRSIANSEANFARARKVMPGGVSSPVRAFKAVGGTPLFIREGEGCVLTDVDGNAYIDYVGSYGPLIAGHANERVVAALSKAIGRGTSFGAPTEGETQLATVIAGALPSVEMVRFVNSGTEAAMSAIRLARAATGRNLIVKCIGCYHGHSDAMLVQAGSGALTLGTPSSPGVPASVAGSTLLVHYNDLQGAEKLFAEHGPQIACFAIEPIAGNMGLVVPSKGYLQGLRDLCDRHGALLLFDEVMTGFRVAWGGPRKLMEQISPAGPVYQAGTLSGNPVAMAAGLATLEILREPDAYETLDARGDQLAKGLTKAASEAGVPVAVNRVGSMVGLFLVSQAGQQVLNYTDATACDTAAYATFFHAMLDQGVYLAPSLFETWFVSLAHDEAAIEETIKAASRAFEAVAKERSSTNAHE